MALKLKICGITRLEDARYCAAAGADYLGFVQHPESPRYIDPSAAKEIIDWVYGPEPVGVFVNLSAEEINAAVHEAGFSLAQLHGDEAPDICADVDVPVIKAMRIGGETTTADVAAFFERYSRAADYILLDTRVEGLWGGSGAAFDWNIANAEPHDLPVFLAGGIRSSNLEDATDRVGPHGIDVSSGLESSPGTKDFAKIDAFFDVFNRMKMNGRQSAGD